MTESFQSSPVSEQTASVGEPETYMPFNEAVRAFFTAKAFLFEEHITAISEVSGFSPEQTEAHLRQLGMKRSNQVAGAWHAPESKLLAVCDALDIADLQTKKRISRNEINGSFNRQGETLRYHKPGTKTVISF